MRLRFPMAASDSGAVRGGTNVPRARVNRPMLFFFVCRKCRRNFSRSRQENLKKREAETEKRDRERQQIGDFVCAARNDERQRSDENRNSIESMYVLDERSEKEKYTESRKGASLRSPTPETS